MTQHNHQTAPTQFVEANGIRFAYRRFGNPAGVPLVFNQHFTGTLDHRDPAVTDGFAEDREVVLFNNAGVSSSSGEVPTTIEKMGANAVAFITALVTVDFAAKAINFPVFGRVPFAKALARHHFKSTQHGSLVRRVK